MVLVSDLAEKKSIHWLKIRLAGKVSNSDGIGATVQLHVGSSVLTKPNDGQSGYLSQSVQPLYFGLDEEKVVDKVVVKWPSGGTQTFPGPIDANQLIELAEE
jgi:hypothetical protein